MYLTGGKKVDRTVIAGGGTEQLPIAYKLTRPAGGIGDLVAADTPPRLNIDTADFCRFVAHHKLSGGLCPGGRRRLERLMGICKSGRLQPEKLITQEFRGFDAIEDAFDLMASKSRDIVKPIIYV